MDNKDNLKNTEEEFEHEHGEDCDHDHYHEHGSDCDHDHDDHDHDGDCCDHDHELAGHIHESDPNDPVTKICADLNDQIEQWEKDGQLTEENLKKALKQFDEALTMTTSHMEALLGKAFIQGELGLSAEATATLLRAHEVDPQDIRVKSMLLQLGEFGDDDAPDLEAIGKYMDELGNPTPKFKAALTDIFDRFAVGEPKGLTKKSIDKFHHTVNGTPISDSGLDYLFSGEWELDSNKSLTLNGFIQFYLNQTFADMNETVRDLQKFGYDENLDKK